MTDSIASQSVPKSSIAKESPLKDGVVKGGPIGDANTEGQAAPTPQGALTNEEFEAKVAEVVKIIRPAVQADQGDIFLRSVDVTTGDVNVELVGACVSCPASTQTLKDGLQRILQQRVEGVTAVNHVGEELLGAEEGTPVSL